jgi:hypothetical protein
LPLERLEGKFHEAGGSVIRIPRVQFTLRRMMVALALVAVILAIHTLANDPVEAFHRQTGLSRPIQAKLIASGTGQTFPGQREFRLDFDTDQETVAEWLSNQPAGGWRGWHVGSVPGWITATCPFAREVFNRFPIETPGSKNVHFAFRHPTISDHEGELIVIDQPAGRVWYCAWWYY